MKIFGIDSPEWLLKVGKQKHLEAICNGMLYMNESGYFRRLDDNFRGDIYDGKCPLSMEKSGTPSLTFFSLDNPEQKVEIPAEAVKSFVTGFKGDDKIPLFCCCQVDESILYKETETKWGLKEEFVKEMEQFGEYYLLLDKNELLNALSNHAKEIGARFFEGKVVYSDIFSEYGMDKLTDLNKNIIYPFFNKDSHYEWQNEWRACLFSEEKSLISNSEDHYEVYFEPLKFAIIGKVSDLYKQTISVQSDE